MRLLSDADTKKLIAYVKNNDTQRAAERILLTVGFKNKLFGTAFLREAVVAKAAGLACSCKEIYAQVALKFQTNANCIERAIRNAIADCLLYGHLPRLNDLFGVPFVKSGYAPTNSEMICELAGWIVLVKTSELTSLRDEGSMCFAGQAC